MEHILDKTWQNIAELSKLYVTEAEAARMKADMKAMLSCVEKMNELNTDAVDVSHQELRGHNVLREDVVINADGQESALVNAPKCSQGMFEVPSTLS